MFHRFAPRNDAVRVGLLLTTIKRDENFATVGWVERSETHRNSV
jgi:hypothetical protein